MPRNHMYLAEFHTIFVLAYKKGKYYFSYAYIEFLFNILLETRKVKWKESQSCTALCDPMDYTVHGILQTRILDCLGSLSLLQGIFPIQGSNPGLPHCKWILYHLSHQWSPKPGQYLPGATPGAQKCQHHFQKECGLWRPCKDKWGFLWLVLDGEACRDTSVWLKYRDQTMISKPISFASLHKGPWMSPLPTLSRTDWHLLHRTSLQNAECMSSLHSRLNRSPGKCFQWVPEMAVWIFF